MNSTENPKPARPVSNRESLIARIVRQRQERMIEHMLAQQAQEMDQEQPATVWTLAFPLPPNPFTFSSNLSIHI